MTAKKETYINYLNKFKCTSTSVEFGMMVVTVWNYEYICISYDSLLNITKLTVDKHLESSKARVTIRVESDVHHIA